MVSDPPGSISSLALSGTGSAGVPASQRGGGGLPGFVERLQRPPHLVHPVVEQVADQQVGERALQVRVVLHDVAEAESVVVLAHQPPHAIHALVEQRAPLAELRGGRVARRQPFDDRVGGLLAGSKRQQHAGGIQRVEEAERVADEHPAVAGDLLRPVRIVLRREVAR